MDSERPERLASSVEPAQLSSRVQAGLLLLLALLPGLSLALIGSAEAAFAYHMCSRIAYVAFAGVSLARMDRRRESLPPSARIPRYLSFRRRVNFLMNNDAVSFAALLWTTRASLELHWPWPIVAALGALPFVIGVWFRIWALHSLGTASYYWRDFFVGASGEVACRLGPYRWLAHPMYTLGYAHTYGLALLFVSWPGLIAAAIAQLSMILLARLVEDPHVERLYGQASWSVAPMESP